MIVRDKSGNVTAIVTMHDHGRALNYSRIPQRTRRTSTAAEVIIAALVVLGMAGVMVLLLAIIGAP